MLGVASALVVALVISLIVRPVGSYTEAIDGWGVALLEILIGLVCLGRYFERSWHTSSPLGRTVPLLLGAALASWGVGDFVLTALGGPNAPVPSAADIFYTSFFVLGFAALAILIRRGNRSSLLATALDGVIAGLGVAAVSAAFVVSEVIQVTQDGRLSAVTQLVYPLGDVLLLAVCIGALAVLPRGYRPFFAIASVALAANAIGDAFNLLQPDSRFGYIANGAAWPISITLLAIAVWVLKADVEVPRVDRVPGFTLPSIGALIGLVVLFLASVAHIGRPAVGLATATLLVAGVRLVLSAREVQELKSARFISLIDKTWDLIVVAEADLRVAYVTPSSERVLGYAAGRLGGDALHRPGSPGRLGCPERTADRIGRGRERGRLLRGPHAPCQRRVPRHRVECGQPPPRRIGDGLRAERRRRHRGAPGRGRSRGRPRRGTRGVEDEVRVRVDDEPRDPDAHERRDRPDGAPPGDRARQGAARTGVRRQGLGRAPARHHQRHPGLLEDRGGQARH